MLKQWETLIIFILIAFGLTIFLGIIVFVVSPSQKNKEKLSAYECGFEPFGDARHPFDVHFYLIAILFMIFDVELVFLFPWAINVYNSTSLGFLSGIIFLFILLIGFLYEWSEGILNWFRENTTQKFNNNFKIFLVVFLNTENNLGWFTREKSHTCSEQLHPWAYYQSCIEDLPFINVIKVEGWIFHEVNNSFTYTLFIMFFLLLFINIFIIFEYNPLYAIFRVIIFYIALAFILIAINLEFIGLVLLIVYVGAIAMLFLFIVMMTNFRKLGFKEKRSLHNHPHNSWLILEKMKKNKKKVNKKDFFVYIRISFFTFLTWILTCVYLKEWEYTFIEDFKEFIEIKLDKILDWVLDVLNMIEQEPVITSEIKPPLELSNYDVVTNKYHATQQLSSFFELWNYTNYADVLDNTVIINYFNNENIHPIFDNAPQEGGIFASIDEYETFLPLKERYFSKIAQEWQTSNLNISEENSSIIIKYIEFFNKSRIVEETNNLLIFSSKFPDINIFSKYLYTNFAAALIMSALLLLVTMIGVIILTRAPLNEDKNSSTNVTFSKHN